MPLSILADDLARVTADILVNSAHPEPIIGTGVDAAIHAEAGPALLNARQQYGTLALGALFKSPAFDLAARQVYHVLTPNYESPGAANQLAQIYADCLQEAVADDAQSIAFPLLGSGNHIFPKALALEIAHREIVTFLKDHELDVLLVVYEPDHFVLPERYPVFEIPPVIEAQYATLKAPDFEPFEVRGGFQPLLFKMIDARRLNDVTVYKRANISRKVFSKIRSNPQYHPSEKTAIALAIGLECSLDETLDLLGQAGYTLSESILFDQIITHFIDQKIFDIFTINETLFFYDQSTL